MEKFPLTAKGFAKLDAELKKLKSVERPAIAAMIGRSEVIDPSRLSGAVKFGATVILLDEDTEVERTYQIVGEAEASIEQGLLNMKSPLARALIGKEPGDSVEVSTPGGLRSYEIRAVNFV